MKCKCGGEMEYYKGYTPDADYVECNKCKARVYTNSDYEW